MKETLREVNSAYKSLDESSISHNPMMQKEDSLIQKRGDLKHDDQRTS